MSVVFWHWRHFFLPKNPAGVALVETNLPLYQTLSVFYTGGGGAVPLFFTLSGFIFFGLYSDRISKGGIPFQSFLLLRLSRLYPLHLATLLFVALGQFVYREMTGVDFVYSPNDLALFLCNLVMASGADQRLFLVQRSRLVCLGGDAALHHVLLL